MFSLYDIGASGHQKRIRDEASRNIELNLIDFILDHEFGLALLSEV